MMIRWMILIGAGLAACGCSMNEGSGTPGVAQEFKGLPLILVEDFDEPAPEQWEPTDPKAWKFLEDGERTVYGMIAKSDYKPPHRSPEGISLLKDIYVGDFILDAWVRSMTKNYNHRDMCFFFGHKDASHFYYVHLGLKSDNSSNTIHIVNDAPRTPIVLTRTDGTPWTEGYHHVRIVRRVGEGAIEAYFDDMTTPCMTAQDTTFTWGRIGLGSFDDTGYIDKVILWGDRVYPTQAASASTR